MPDGERPQIVVRRLVAEVGRRFGEPAALDVLQCGRQPQLQTAYGRPMGRLGQGGSIPLCTVLAETYPDAEILLIGVEEPQALIHAPNESVAPREIAAMALTEALFLREYGALSGRRRSAAG